MHDTRWTVLELIRTLPQATVASLAEALNVTPITVRHHLGNLQSEGLITVTVERKHVGRPKHVYTLTEAAQRYFPNQYHVLADRLLDTLKEMLPPDKIAGIIDSVATNVAAQYGKSSCHVACALPTRCGTSRRNPAAALWALGILFHAID